MITAEELAKEIEINRPALMRCAVSILKNESDAKDAVGEMTLRAIEHRDGLKNLSSVRSWLFQILWNVSRTLYVKRNRQEPMNEAVLFGIMDRSRDISRDEDFSAGAIRDEERLSLHAAVEELSDDFREVIELYYFRGLSVGQIAEQLSISEGTVKSRLYRGRRDLRKLLSSIIACLCIVVGSVLYVPDTRIAMNDTTDSTSDFFDASETGDAAATETYDATIDDYSDIKTAPEDICDDTPDVILFVTDESEIDNTRVCYVTSTGTLYLPNRELTDEERAAVNLVKLWQREHQQDEAEADNDTSDKKSSDDTASDEVTPDDTTSDESTQDETESSGRTPLIAKSDDELRTAYVENHNQYIADYDRLYSGLERPDGNGSFATTEEMIDKNMAWQRKWIEAGRLDDTAPVNETNDISYGADCSGSKTSDICGDTSDESSSENPMASGNSHYSIVGCSTMEHLRELIPDEIDDAEVIECIYDPDAPYGVAIEDERIRNFVIESFATLGIPESGRLFVVDFSQSDNTGEGTHTAVTPAESELSELSAAIAHIEASQNLRQPGSLTDISLNRDAVTSLVSNQPPS